MFVCILYFEEENNYNYYKTYTQLLQIKGRNKRQHLQQVYNQTLHSTYYMRIFLYNLFYIILYFYTESVCIYEDTKLF